MENNLEKMKEFAEKMQSCVLFTYGSMQEPYFFIVLYGLKIM